MQKVKINGKSVTETENLKVEKIVTSSEECFVIRSWKIVRESRKMRKTDSWLLSTLINCTELCTINILH